MTKIKKKSFPSSLIVTQSNKLVEARYNLSLGEQRLIIAMIAQIQPDDEDFKPYRISIGDLADFLGVSKGSAYHECKKITKSLLGRVLEVQENGRLLQIGWVSSADYIDGTGIVSLSFDPLLKPYLLQLKGNFTSCKFEMLLGFKSQYTMRMYSLLKQYEQLKKREIELDLLRVMLGLRVDQYKLYANFKTDLLKPAQVELKEKSDLYFEFDEIKYGRKVGAIRFHIIKNKGIKTAPDDIIFDISPIIFELPSPEVKISNSIVELLLLVPEQHKSKKTVLSALDFYESKHGFDYVKRNILYSNAKAAKSYAGYLNSALKEDWGHDWELEQQQAVQVKKKSIEVWERQGFSSEKEYAEHSFRKQMEALQK
ncbi:MAG: replication initiation protein [Methylobacter sp.]|nr:replication initiation protein [Methylobacter sp.]MDP2099869.1 replication initiation protein [Methylobacter sp.]MDP2427767.1 replication initiation protein [Methylobacter sp.]MDP3360870.1 replication initiation protein [Methylobacter sp.]